eukprot:538863_1
MQKILMTLTYACCCKRNKNMLVLFSLYIVTSLASAQNPTPINISLEEKISTATIWINELHYDNDGKDVGEFVEIAGIAHTTLGNYQIYLYSGADGLMYKDLSFNTGSIPKQQNGFGTVLLTFDQIQNGGNGGDGVALIYSDNNVDYVVQFLSYEGQFMANDGPANGRNSADIGITQSTSAIVNSSLCLTGLGYQYEDFTWSTCLVSTPGAININQTITTPNPTESPSLNPTESPSLYSTQWPSKIPTNVPSTIPTQSPSATHILPITTPTATPIQSPTLAPTYALSDLQSNEIIETTNERNNQTFDGKAAPGLNTATVNYIIIIVSIIICCCIIVTILVIYIRILKQNEQRIMEKRVSKNMEISNLPSPTNKSINHDIGEKDVIDSAVNNMEGDADQITQGEDLIHINANNSHKKTNEDVINETGRDKNHNDDDLEVMKWLEDIGFAQHAGKFTVNGYHSLGMIKTIDSHQQLVE